jgi:methylenetetrahydrofolate reductase (NADPH)
MGKSVKSSTLLLPSETLNIMQKPIIHPNWLRAPDGITDGFSLEITAKDVAALTKAAPQIPPATPIAVTFLPGETVEARITATKAVRSLGFEPMPHFSARRLTSSEEFKAYLQQATQEAGVKRCFVIAGDTPEPAGPFSDSSSLIATGEFERAGITAIGIGGHPDGHPNMSPQECWDVLEKKRRDIESRGMAPLVVTQFGFDPDAVLSWLQELRARGIDCPVRIGVPGPASITTLVRFAARCGVSATSSARLDRTNWSMRLQRRSPSRTARCACISTRSAGWSAQWLGSMTMPRKAALTADVELALPPPCNLHSWRQNVK